MSASAFRSFENSTVKHGTVSGARFHSGRGERPCDPCYRAKAVYDKRRRSTPAQVLRNRLTASAQRRALSAVAKNHYDEYRAFYEAFKQELEREAELEAQDA